MRTRALFVLALLAALLGAGLTSANAAPAAAPIHAAVAAATGVYHVPPITCESDTACQLSFNGNGDLQGYWMAKRVDGTKWVRLTKVAGWDNTYAAPITCAAEDSCVLDYYWPVNGGLGLYWMARQMDGTTWVRLTLIPGLAAKTGAGNVSATTPSLAVRGASGWRFRHGDICVLDKTAGRLPGGLAKPIAAWSKSPFLNLTLRTSCTGYPVSQTITVTAFTRFYGDCQTAKVWTTGGYLKPGRVTRADLAINTECNTTALALGLPIGLKLADSNDYGTVMGAAGWPTPRDFRIVARIYTGAGAR